jgi:hypothetical protein
MRFSRIVMNFKLGKIQEVAAVAPLTLSMLNFTYRNRPLVYFHSII